MDVLTDWALVEADFQREYGINLCEALPRMSWRRFILLLNGLSTDAVFILTNKAREDGTAPIEDDNVAEKTVEAYL